MSDDAEKSAAPNPQPHAGQPTPQLRMISQYTRDLSFENPAAGKAMSSRPDIQVGVNVNARKVEGAENRYEVSVVLKATAEADSAPAFVAEVDYAGVFQLDHAPEKVVHPMLLIECPRLLFPFARRVLADVSRDGGYPPLMLDPIDFAALYRQQLENQRKQQAAQQPAGNA